MYSNNLVIQVRKKIVNNLYRSERFILFYSTNNQKCIRKKIWNNKSLIRKSWSETGRRRHNTCITITRHEIWMSTNRITHRAPELSYPLFARKDGTVTLTYEYDKLSTGCPTADCPGRLSFTAPEGFWGGDLKIFHSGRLAAEEKRPGHSSKL